jgi:hypothetical protein
MVSHILEIEGFDGLMQVMNKVQVYCTGVHLY